MVQILPSFALVHQSLIRDFLGRSHLFVGHLVQNLKSLTSYQALMVSGEDIWGLELCVQNSISEDFLHHFFLGSLAIGASNIVATVRTLRSRRIRSQQSRRGSEANHPHSPLSSSCS
jgi:hypothetical protein